MKQEIKIGTTDYTANILMRDDTGAIKTGLTFESAGLDISYVRVETDNDVVITACAPASTTLTGAHTDWGFVEVDSTNHPGVYKLDIADGVFASGAWTAIVTVIGTGLDPSHIEYILKTNMQDDIATLVGTAQSDLDELTDAGTLSGVRLALMLDRIYTRLFHEVNVTDADGVAAIRNAADDANIATGAITDDDTTTSQAAWVWA